VLLFLFYALPVRFVIGALQTKGVYTELKQMSQAPFSLFFIMSIFNHQEAKVKYF